MHTTNFELTEKEAIDFANIRSKEERHYFTSVKNHRGKWAITNKYDVKVKKQRLTYDIRTLLMLGV